MTDLDQLREKMAYRHCRYVHQPFHILVIEEYRYFVCRNSLDRYSFTARRIKYGQRKRFVAGILRWLSSKGRFKLVFSAGYLTKEEAIAKAYGLCQRKA